MLGSDDDFWVKVGIDPVRIMTTGGTYYTLRCYLDDLPVFLGRNGRISVFGSERALARYLADEHDHDISNLATYDDIRTAANDGSLRVNVSDENVYVLTEIVDYLAEGPDAIDRDQLDLAVELLRDVGEYAEDTVVEESLDADQPLGKIVAYVLDPDKVRKPTPAVREGRRAVGGAGDLRRIATARRIGLQLGRFRVARLVKAEVTATGEPDAGEQAPALVADRTTRHALGLEVVHRRVDVVAHQVQLMRTCSLGWVHGHLGGRQFEDQPTPAGVDAGVLQHIAGRTRGLLRRRCCRR